MTEVKKVGSGLDASSNKRPTNWVTPTLGEVYTVVGGGTPSTEKADYWGTGTPWVTSADIYGVRDIKPRKQVTQAGIEHSTTQVVPHKTLLVVTRVGLGKIAITETETCFSQDVQGLIQRSDLIAPEFSLYFLSYELQILKHQGRGTTISGITKKQLTDLEFPLPPYKEQQRIVAKIEELFSELDKGVENLRTAQQQLKVYRQALLKHAFEGKLTADWRAQNPDKLESADALLARIQKEREAGYQQQLHEWQAAQQVWEANGKIGSKPNKPRAPKALPQLAVEELAEFPELPEGWAWVKLGEVLWSVKDGPHFSPKYTEAGIPFISGGNVRPDGIDFKRAKRISAELHEELCRRCKPEFGDVLYTKGGTTGIARVNNYDFEFNVWVHVAVLKPVKSIFPFYLQHALNSQFCYAQAQKYTHGVGNQDLGLTRMVNIILPMCSLNEQTQVTEAIEDKLSLLDNLEQTITHSLHQADVLRQSILKKAFSGQLVPQDPNDEPASVLLERIRAERAAQPKARGRKAKA
ncbi:restriction endonuclease subunit S [Stutzerimonas chloritidismutans]|uniref:restriction endonuclease subunit S n=1 Tax=Stutzerimonas chloritidismutans TaxID=203192 RepID=UPI00384A4819